MPRSLDAAARETAVIDAAWRVIVRDGVAALTVRRVAAEAGLAPSSLRYSFPTQAAVRERALSEVARRTRQRIDALPAQLPGRAWARSALLELLPLDPRRRLEMEVFLALGMASLTDDSLVAAWGEADELIRETCARALAAMGVAARGVEAMEVEEDERRIDGLHSLIDGLALHLLVPGRRRTADWALMVVDGLLADHEAADPS